MECNKATWKYQGADSATDVKSVSLYVCQFVGLCVCVCVCMCVSVCVWTVTYQVIPAASL